jgi:hypothetical protein
MGLTGKGSRYSNGENSADANGRSPNMSAFSIRYPHEVAEGKIPRPNALVWRLVNMTNP